MSLCPQTDKKVSKESWLVTGSYTGYNKKGPSLGETSAMIRPCFNLIGRFLLHSFFFCRCRLSLVPLPTRGRSALSNYRAHLISSAPQKDEEWCAAEWEEKKLDEEEEWSQTKGEGGTEVKQRRRRESAWIETNNLLCGWSSILNFTYSSLLIVLREKLKKTQQQSSIRY